jgi:cysteinyl-tRNA synthetase
MTIKLYNTLTRKKENFKPVIKDLLKIYVCGVTVYDDVHIGHAMSYIYYDMLINYFKHFHDYQIYYIRNITDVGHLTDDGLGSSGEDKLIKRAKERKVHPMELAYKYSHRMWESFDKLKITRPNIEPQASGHIPEIIEWVKKLIDNGYAYETKNGIYFNISKYKEYGSFSNRKLEQLLKDTRFENDKDKKTPADFAVWIKAKPEHILKWNSPWGQGYPGWHIECSVMGNKYLGDTFDIHGGGIEHVFPHHENEIAQNFGCLGKKMVNYWVHTAMLSINGKKMGKSLGNFITIEDFLKKNTAEQLRFVFLTGHYRKPQNYTEKSVDDAKKTLENINNFIKRLKEIKSIKETQYSKEILETISFNFKKAMDNDLNTPSAWAQIFFLIKEVNKLMDKDMLTKKEAMDILEFLKKVDLVFKVFNFETEKNNKNKMPKEEIEKLILKRETLRKQKKWEEADIIRMNLQKKGILLFDNKEKTTWTFE